MKHFVVAALIFASPLVQAHPAHELDRIDAEFTACADNAKSTYDQNMCARDAHAAADVQLNKIYNAIAAPLQRSSQPDDKEILKRLVAAERAWVVFRDTNCQLAGVQMLGGSGEGPIVGGCLASTTISRARELLSLFETQN